MPDPFSCACRVNKPDVGTLFELLPDGRRVAAQAVGIRFGLDGHGAGGAVVRLARVHSNNSTSGAPTILRGVLRSASVSVRGLSAAGLWPSIWEVWEAPITLAVEV